MGIITGYSRRTANIGSGGGGSVATTLYNSDDTLADQVRLVSLYGNTSSDKLIFQTLSGGDVLSLYGNKTVLIGDESKPYTKFDPYGISSFGILQFCAAGTTTAYNVYDSGNNERFRVESSGLVYAKRGSIGSFLNYTSSINFWADGTSSNFYFVGTNGSYQTLYLGNDSGHAYAEIKNNTGTTKTRLSGNGDSYFINSLAIGVSTAHSSALLDIQTSTKGLGLPTMTTAEKNAIGSPRTGLCVFDTTLGALSVYNGAAWI